MISNSSESPQPGRRLQTLIALGVVQLLLWLTVAFAVERFSPSGLFERRPLLPVLGLMALCFILYLWSVALFWKPQVHRKTLRVEGLILGFAVLFRLALWWSQPIEELDIYRYLWDGRVLAHGINPYRYSPAEIEEANRSEPATLELATLSRLLGRSPEIAKTFSLIDHRSVPTIYPPFSEAVFAATALITPEHAPVRQQVCIFKAVLLLFDVATIGLLMGLLRNLKQPPTRALAYAWCPLVLKEFANTGHLDAIAVCLTVAVLWLLTLSRRESESPSKVDQLPSRPRSRDWLAAALWGGAVLAKLYPLVLAPVLLAFWWRRLRWRTCGLLGVFGIVLFSGYEAMPPISRVPTTAGTYARTPSSFSGLREFVRRWEMNDLLFSFVYENVRPYPTDHPKPWYSVCPTVLRERLNGIAARTTAIAGLSGPADRLPFLLTQALMAGTLLVLAAALALRRWPDDPREALLSRSFLCLAWLWFLSATQNPWYWTWALPLAVFASPSWLLVSGFALIYYLRFWFVHHFPDSVLPGGLTGARFFDEIVVWFEQLLPLCAVAAAVCLSRKRIQARSATAHPLPPAAKPDNVIVVIPALNEETSLPFVLDRLRAQTLKQVRVVDNGSRDRTSEVARGCGAEVICEPRRGYGQACWTGCQNLPANAQWILFCNADGSDDLERIADMLAITERGVEFVLGTRGAAEDGKVYLTASQRFGNKLAVVLIRLLWGTQYNDLGPLRLISRPAFELLNLQDRGFGWTVEMQVRAAEEGLRVAQVSVRNFQRCAGISKISGTIAGSLRAGTTILTTIAALWLKRQRA